MDQGPKPGLIASFVKLGLVRAQHSQARAWPGREKMDSFHPYWAHNFRKMVE